MPKKINTIKTTAAAKAVTLAKAETEGNAPATTALAKKPAVRKSAVAKKQADNLLGDVLPGVAKKKKAVVAKQAAIKPKKKVARSKIVTDPHGLFLAPAAYKAAIDGLMDQGLDHPDAVATLKVGMRQANGRPVPLALQMDVSPAMYQDPASAALMQ